MKILLVSIYWSIALPFCSGLWANIPQDCDELAAPRISSEKIVSCVGQPIVLKAMNCVGTVVWSNQKKGNTLTVYPEKTTTYQAHCIKDSCKSKASNEVTVTINIPSSPLIKASQTKVCFGESVVLTATGCAGEVIWSNGLTGQEMTIQPIYSTKYTATCRNEGCVSCFADDIIITVVGGEPLSLTANKTILCKGESSILSAKGNCAGQIRWSNGAIAKTITVQPEHTTYYWAMCENTNCEPVKSSITLQVTPPLAPLLKVDKQTICNGERVTLTAEGCNGILQWSNGMQGRTLQIQPSVSAQYTAVCLRGDCSSTPSLPISITVHENVLSSPQITKELKNTCPFITVDLSAVLSQKPPKGIYYEAHLGSSYLSPLVTDISAVSENRSYYIFARNKYNCYSLPTEVKVSISPCDKPLPICTNNPATALFEKSERTAVGNYYLQGKVGGAASSGHWSTNGTGTFNTNNGLSTIYSPSAEDRQAGKVMIQFSSDDPDGQGPCKAGAVWYELKVDTHTDKPKEVIGINKFVKGWKKLKNHLFEIEYVIQVVNMGANDLVEISIIDSLDRVFKNGAVIVDKPIITAIDPATNSEIKWGIDESYSGKNGFYNLLLPEKCSLLAGQARVIMIRSKIDFANAKDSMYYNSAWVSALDINGNRCLDKSVNGNWPDINQNEDPTDDTESTPLALNSLLGNEGDIFIPEGFSPNSDGVNDFFMVRKPTHLKASLEIYNRWGGLIYQTEDYKNDWNGGANTQANAPSGTYFYVLKLSDGREFSRFLTISR